jgi:ATP-dependent helicase HrpA
MKQRLDQLYQALKQCYLYDRYPLKKNLHKLSRKLKHQSTLEQNSFMSLLEHCENRISRSIEKVQQRRQRVPKIDFPDTLPVARKLEVIQQAIKAHQVIIVAGETGSGKTTQLPKIALSVGRGVFGQIAHTQPRRLAARSVAERIADELHSQLGEAVGYKVRFNDKSRDETYIKLMTDGILLAETQHDRLLNHYDTIIIDEAHERSLNIDFLLGYIKQLLPKRADLKVIITSATIDTDRFSSFFSNAPVIEVSGRTYPVEVRYRALSDKEQDADTFTNTIGDSIAGKTRESVEKSVVEGVLDAVDELSTEPEGDILVFLPGEREIRETAEALRKHHPTHTEILPLYARLSHAEQSRIFASHPGRRIILATNVAETSLTVPGIRYVIDTGLVRMSRYSIRHKIQRLPIEKVSQASARQRSGRCGRVSKGIAIRLYSEQDHDQRPAFTEPELLRTNLAQVILQMLSLSLGDINAFPFIEPPSSKLINDGFLLLEQLEAINTQRQLTAMGRSLARFSVDPKIARVIIAAEKSNVLSEILVIAAALSCQEPRERPVDKQQAADEKHAQFVSKKSDFITYLNLWFLYEQQRKHLSQSKLRKYCKSNFLSYMRMREWRELYQQLYTQAKESGFSFNVLDYHPPEDEEQLNYMAIHQCLLSGFLANVAYKEDKTAYLGTRGMRLAIFPGSKLYKTRPKWIMAAEIVETSSVFARTVAGIEPLWLEKQAGHLIRSQYFEPFWESKPGQVSAWSKLTLYGLVINPKKKVNYGPIDPDLSREIFIRDALVSGEYKDHHKRIPKFIQHNLDLIHELEHLEHKSRRRDLLVDELTIFEFYAQRIDVKIYSRAAFEKWRKKIESDKPQYLFMQQDDLLKKQADHISDELYPPTIQCGRQGHPLSLPLEYHFLPGHALDGVTVVLPLSVINQLDENLFAWLVPGLIREKITLLIRSLPKSIRKQFVPVPDTVTAFLQNVPYRKGDLQQQLLAFLESKNHSIRRLSNEDALNLAGNIPEHLKMNYKLLDQQGEELVSSRDFTRLRQQWGKQAMQQLEEGMEDSIERDGIIDWDFTHLPEKMEIERHGMSMLMYPALVDRQESVSIKLFDRQQAADKQHYQGVFRLLSLRLRGELKRLKKELPRIDKLCLLFSPFGSCHELKDDLINAVVVNCLDAHKRINDEFEFSRLEKEVRDKLQDAKDEVCKATLNALLENQKLASKLKGNIPFNLVNCISDIKMQQQNLIYKGFIAHTPLVWLKRLPRYLKAMQIRIDKAQRDYRKDRLNHMQIESLWERYTEIRASVEKNINEDSRQSKSYFVDQALLEYRWLIEELRVSLFAQELKTSQPVSVKRLDKKWQDINAIS